MKRSIVFSLLTLLVFASIFSFTAASAKPAANKTVLVWTGNGGYHVEIVGLTTNATGWGYDVTGEVGTMNSTILDGIDILIVNAPDYIEAAEVTAMLAWFNGASGRSMWVVGESDYGGYWLPDGTNVTKGVNDLLREAGAHIFVQDDAVNDAVSQDGGGYRVVANTPNPETSNPVKAVTQGVENVSMHGPTAVIPYSAVTEAGLGIVANFDDIENCDYILNTSMWGSIADQDFDDNAFWEGFPVAVNMSLTMAAIEWNVGTESNKICVTGESIFADYKDMFGYETRYANDTALQNIQLSHNILDWFAGKIGGAAPGFEGISILLVLAVAPIVVRKRRK